MNRIKYILATLTLIAGAFTASAKAPLFKYGAEWGIGANIFYDKQLNYITEEGYRIDDSVAEGAFIPNGQILGSIGINATGRFSISLMSGYLGVSRNNRMIPILLRAGYHFNGLESDGLFAFIDGGIGIHLRKTWEPERKPAGMTDAGMGYRFILTHRTSLDLLFNVKGTFDTLLVTDPDSGEFIKENNIRKNNAFFLTLNVGLGINF